MRAGQVRLDNPQARGLELWRTGDPCDCGDHTCVQYEWTEYPDEGATRGRWFVEPEAQVLLEAERMVMMLADQGSPWALNIRDRMREAQGRIRVNDYVLMVVLCVLATLASAAILAVTW